MDSQDHDLIRLLVLDSTIMESEVPALSTWWGAEGLSDESLVAFLHREGVLRDGVLRMLDLSRKGYMRIDRATSLIRDDGLPRLHHALRHHSREQSVPSPVEVERTAQPEVARTTTSTAERPRVASSSNACRIGELLGKCLLTEEIGRGGYGIVYRALHTSLKIPVAVKTLLSHESDPALVEEFRSEALTLARLNHPNVVRVLDIDDGSTPYFVLEYIEGPSLRELIRQSGRIQADRAIEIMIQAASGLSAAASLGIVHRDVTPANILLMRDGTAKITDFGLAAFLADLDTSPDLEARGTAAYMSPEQARGDSIDARSDIYSLGATFYHAMTGIPPFSGGTRNQILLRHAMESPIPPSAIVPELNPAVCRLILKMMAKTPDARFPHFEALIAGLKELSTTSRSAIDPGDSTSSNSKKRTWFGRLARREQSHSLV